MAWTKDKEMIGLKVIWWVSAIAAAILAWASDNHSQVGFGIALGFIGGAVGFALEGRPDVSESSGLTEEAGGMRDVRGTGLPPSGTPRGIRSRLCRTSTKGEFIMKTAGLVYDDHGMAYRLVAEVPDSNGYVVRRVMVDEDGEYEGDPEIFHGRLHKTVPAQKYDAKIQILQEDLGHLREEAQRLRGEISEATEERRRLQKVLTENETLRHIEDVLAGRITHVLVIDGWEEAKVIPFTEAMDSEESSYPKKLRLLTLHGATGGDLRWRINVYSDGSGGSKYTMLPFPSEEQAVAAKRQHLVGVLAAAVVRLPNLGYRIDALVSSARELAIPIPPELTKAMLDDRQKKASEKAEIAKKQLEDYGNELAAIERERSNA